MASELQVVWRDTPEVMACWPSGSHHVDVRRPVKGSLQCFNTTFILYLFYSTEVQPGAFAALLGRQIGET